MVIKFLELNDDTFIEIPYNFQQKDCFPFNLQWNLHPDSFNIN